LGWVHPLVWASLVCFVIGSPLFLLVEARRKGPMLPLSLFHSPAVSASCIVGFIFNFAFFGLLFVLSLFFQTTKGYPPLMTGLAFLPITVLMAIGNLIGGSLTARFGSRLPMASGQALAACGYLALIGTDAGTRFDLIVGPMLAAGLGVALTVPAMTVAVLANTARERAGIASGALHAARQAGGVIGVGVFGSLVAGDAERFLDGAHIALIVAGAMLALGCIASVVWVRTTPAKERLRVPAANAAAETVSDVAIRERYCS